MMFLKGKSRPTEAARDWKERQTEFWLGRRHHSAASSLKPTLFENRRWKRVCTEQMERRAGDRRTDEDSYFDKLRFGEPDGCYETHSVFKGRLKRSLDHSFETAPGTVRHWRRANTDMTDEFRAKETRLRAFLHFSLTHHYSGTWSFRWTWRIRTQEALWGRWCLWACGSRTPADFLLELENGMEQDEKPDVHNDIRAVKRCSSSSDDRQLYFSDILASASLLPWYERTEPCTRLSARRQARSSTGSGPPDQTETHKHGAEEKNTILFDLYMRRRRMEGITTWRPHTRHILLTGRCSSREVTLSEA